MTLASAIDLILSTSMSTLTFAAPYTYTSNASELSSSHDDSFSQFIERNFDNLHP